MNITDEELISIHEGLIYKLARSFYNSSIEDLYQVGIIGLLKAKKNYNSDSKAKFSTYAYEYIYGEMYACVEKNKGIKIGRDILKLCKQIDKIRQKLTQINGQEPTVEEIALYAELPIETICQAISSANSIISYDAQSELNRAIVDTIADTNTPDLIESLALKESLDILDEEEKQIIDLRYYKDMTQSETAKAMKMSQVMISRYEKRGMQKLRAHLSA